MKLEIVFCAISHEQLLARCLTRQTEALCVKTLPKFILSCCVCVSQIKISPYLKIWKAAQQRASKVLYLKGFEHISLTIYITQYQNTGWIININIIRVCRETNDVIQIKMMKLKRQNVVLLGQMRSGFKNWDNIDYDSFIKSSSLWFNKWKCH